MRTRPLDRAVVAGAVLAALAVLVTGCSGGGASDADGATDPSGATAPTDGVSSDDPAGGAEPSGGRTPSRLEQTEVPFTEPTAPATTEPPPGATDVPALLYAVLAERLDPRAEHLAAYDGSNDPATGVGAGKVRGGWSLNAEWRPRGLVGLLVAPQWPDGWLCVDAYPGCREVRLPDGRTAQALPTGRNQVTVGLEQPGGSKVLVSSVSINELSVADLAATAGDERLDLP